MKIIMKMMIWQAQATEKVKQILTSGTNPKNIFYTLGQIYKHMFVVPLGHNNLIYL